MFHFIEVQLLDPEDMRDVQRQLQELCFLRLPMAKMKIVENWLQIIKGTFLRKTSESSVWVRCQRHPDTGFLLVAFLSGHSWLYLFNKYFDSAYCVQVVL